MDKKEIRELIKGRRKALTAEALEADSRIICEKIMELEAFQRTGSVYVYMSCRGEVSMRPLIEEAWLLGKKVAAPKVQGEDLEFYYIRSFDDVESGYFGIEEPVTGEAVSEDEAALLIVPGVGFDGKRGRCGYGKGFYDRYLAAHPQHTTVAAAFEFQMVDEVPTQAHDIRPQYLITEKRAISGHSI